MATPILVPGQVSLALYPAAPVTSASSRLRCYGLGRELARMGHPVRIGVDPDALPRVLFVQKIINPDVLRQARLVKEAGGAIIYDIDDYGNEALGSLKADAETFAQFMELVSVVVVDTEVRRGVYTQEPGFTQVPELWVVPDPIDYLDSADQAPRPARHSGDRLRACWFGNAPNITPSLPYLDVLVHADEVAEVQVMTNASHLEYFWFNHPQFVTTAWALETFPALFRSMDFCVLAHATTLAGVQKSNNKMLASLALGVVPFVSDTPAYAETAYEIGIPELVVRSPEEMLGKLAPDTFAAIEDMMRAERCQEALRHYYPEASARLFSARLLDFLSGT
jgi:hypothetical protein